MFEGQFAGAGEALAQFGWFGGERERAEVMVVDVGFEGEEGVVAAGVVPVFRCGADLADAAGHRLVGFAGERERGARLGADEDDCGAGCLGLVAGVGEAPAAEEGVVGEQLVAVVGGAVGEVHLDEQVEAELVRGMRSSSEMSGLISANVSSCRSMIVCMSPMGISLAVIGWRLRPVVVCGTG